MSRRVFTLTPANLLYFSSNPADTVHRPFTSLVRVLPNNLTEKAEEKDATCEAKNFKRPYVPVTQRWEDH